MASVTKRPTQHVESGSTSDVNWLDISRAYDNNNSTYAYCDFTPDKSLYSRYLYFYAFAFNLPAGSMVRGLSVTCSARLSTSSSVTLYVGLHNNIVSIGSQKSQTISSTTQTNYDFGSSTDTWGTSLTHSTVNGTNFGVWVRVQSSAYGITFFLYNIQATVDYVVINPESGRISSQETVSLVLVPSELPILSSSELIVARVASSESWPIQSQENTHRPRIETREAIILPAQDSLSLFGSLLFLSDPGPLLALEASGFLFFSQEADLLGATEGALVRANLSKIEPGPLASSESRILEALLSTQDLLLLLGIEGPSLQARLSPLEEGEIVGEREEAGVLISVSELFPLLGEEGFQIQFLLEDLLSISGDDLLPILLRILDPRASISLEVPKATIIVLEEGGKLVERIYRGTEAAVILRFSSAIGRYYDPLSVRLLVRKPSGTIAIFPVQRIGPGTYRTELPFDEPGVWVLRAEGVDPLRAITEKRVEVIGDL
jgi:hypothetical protein